MRAESRSPALGGASFWLVMGIERAAEIEKAASLNYVHHPPRAWFHQDRSIVNNCVAITGNMVLLRHIVVADAAFRKYGTDANLFLMPIRGSLFSNHVLAKARSVIHSEDAADRSGHRSDCSAHDSTRRPCRTTTCLCALLGTTDCALGKGIAGTY
jgi:hypothetical protein